MYINFWYPVCLSEELKEEPLKVTILGLDFVAFRDSERVKPIVSVIFAFIEVAHYQVDFVTQKTTPLLAPIMAGDSIKLENALGSLLWD